MLSPQKSLLALAVSAAMLGLVGCNDSSSSNSSSPVISVVTPPPAPVAPETAGFALVNHFAVAGIAEIVAATANGMTLLYTSADSGTVGVVDITDPSKPKSLASIDVKIKGIGEPTSVAVSPDSRYAIVAVRMGDDVKNAIPGLLRIFDIANPADVKFVKDITVGIGPDSIALVGQGTTLRAVVAIEDEETKENGDATIPGVRPGRIDVVGLEDLYGATSTGVQSIALIEPLKAVVGAQFINDPQPEFVSINQTTQKAVVTLQENNAIAILDLSDVTKPRLESIYSAGTVARAGNADLLNDKEIKLTESFTGRREPDGVTWVTKDLYATANEGDTSRTADGVLPGARGFTLFNPAGTVVYETGDRTEKNAVQYGHYLDTRSTSKGVEIEGVASASFGGTPFLFVGSERGHFVEVYRIDNNTDVRFVQLLPTGQSPEGLTTVTGRSDGKQLFVTANEVDGSLNIYQYKAEGAANPAEPQIVAKDNTTPWGALSGLTTDGQSLFAVPDNAFGDSRIFRLSVADVAKGKITIDQVIPLTLADGKPLKADPEGIARVADGFWIASEGATVDGNELIKVSPTGAVLQRVKLSAAMQARFADPKNSTGFEGVTASADGKTLYVALQRGFDINKPFAAILKYSVDSGTWTSAQYPLTLHSKDPKTLWSGISEVQLTSDGRLLILERDKGGGVAAAITSEIKRVYSVPAASVIDGAELSKTLVRDLRKDFNYLQEKAEGLVVFNNEMWVVTDNDGGGWSRMINAGKL